MKFWLYICLAVSLLTPLPALAVDKSSHDAAVEEMLQVLDMKAKMTETVNALLDAQLQGNPELVPFTRTLRAFMDKYFGWDSLKDDVVAIWKETFTEPEIRELTAFYKTPVGQKAMKNLPQLTVKGAVIGQTRAQEHLPELLEMLEADAKKQGIPLQ